MGIFLGRLTQKRPLYQIQDRKECFQDQNSKVLEKTKELKFFKGVSPWFLSKNRIFYEECLFHNLDQKRSFFDILDSKEWF